ncbi:MAG: Stp1/IreP family PP2C-type Ser/Thr phosphatase [Pseudomonadota bacterium]
MSWLTIGSATDQGRVKKENQDYHFFYPPEKGKRHKFGSLIALADGMGGHRGGSIAARTAVDVLFETYYKSAAPTIPQALAEGFAAANTAIFEKSANDPALFGMGCTLAVMAIKDKALHVAHVGDSRGYRISQGQISQLTEDHSLVASLVKAGVISAEEALDHPDKHIITRAIGLQETVEASTNKEPMTVGKGDYLLICCDGLWETVTDGQMLETIQRLKEPSLICDNLVEQANHNGGPDNITVIVARIDGTGILARLF